MNSHSVALGHTTYEVVRSYGGTQSAAELILARLEAPVKTSFDEPRPHAVS